MNDFLGKIHALPEDARKFFAAVSLVVLGFAFFVMWTSFMSSRLVTLNTPTTAPPQKPMGLASPAVAHAPSGTAIAARPEPVSPAAGIVGSITDAEKFFTRPKTDASAGFFAGIGRALASVADAIYMKLARFVPPYL
ncbi:MAG: hypothetical protein AAB916_01325 [Patescibacteria group bacterium]